MTSHPPPSHESKTYHEFADWYERVFERFFGPRIQQTVCDLAIPAGSQVLEVGVGTGLSLAAYPSHAAVTAIDLSPEMLALAQQKVDEHGWDHIALREMNALDLEFADASFDYVTSYHVVSVVPNHRRMMQEMVRVCKPQGTLVLINHFRSPRRWVAAPIDLLDPLTRRLGWRTTVSVPALLADLPLQLESDSKTSWNSLFRILIARKTGPPQ